MTAVTKTSDSDATAKNSGSTSRETDTSGSKNDTVSSSSEETFEKKFNELLGRGNSLKKIKNFDGAEKVYGEAVELCRSMVKREPDYNAFLITSLFLLGDMKVEKSDVAGAQTAMDEALELYRTGNIKITGREFLGVALRGLGDLLARHSNFAEARKKYEDAFEFLRIGVENDPDSYNGELVETLTNYGIALRRLGDYAGAQKAYDEALSICRALVAKDPDRYKPNLAMTLTNYGVMLSALGDNAGAQEAYYEAVALAAENPARNRELLLQLRKIFSSLELKSGDHAGSSQVSDEAKTIGKTSGSTSTGKRNNSPESKKSNFDALKEKETCVGSEKVRKSDSETAKVENNDFAVAKSLTAAAYISWQQRDFVVAKKECEAALNLYRALALEDPDTHTPDLAGVLVLFSDVLFDCKDFDGALNAGEEALELCRALAAKNRKYNYEIALVMNKIGCIMLAKKDILSADMSWFQAEKYIRPLMAEDPDNAKYENLFNGIKKNRSIISDAFNRMNAMKNRDK